MGNPPRWYRHNLTMIEKKAKGIDSIHIVVSWNKQERDLVLKRIWEILHQTISIFVIKSMACTGTTYII